MIYNNLLLESIHNGTWLYGCAMNLVLWPRYEIRKLLQMCDSLRRQLVFVVLVSDFTV